MPKREKAKQDFMVSPLTGAKCPTGAHPGNTGGKKGRSGRKPDAIREALRGIIDEDGIDFVRNVLAGVVILKGKCEHCGEESSGPALADELPTVDNRLRAFAEAARFGLGERSEFSVDVVTSNVDRMLAAAEDLLSEADFKTYCQQADQIWNERE